MNIRLRYFICIIAFLGSAAAPSATAEEKSDIRITPEPGVYSEEIAVKLSSATEKEESKQLYYRFLSSNNDRWIPYLFPVTLPSTSGSERQYTIEVGREKSGTVESIETQRYIIDRKPPEAPSIDIQHQDDGGVTLDFTGVQDGTLYYWHNETAEEQFTQWEGDPIRLSEGTRSSSSLIVRAYVHDAAGNRSPLAKKSTYVSKGECSDAQLSLPSPVEGTFVNPQLLYIPNNECFEWVRYTVNGDDPVYRGAVYDEPVLLRARGEYRLRIAARTQDGETLSIERQFTIKEEAPLSFDFSSGYQERSTTFKPPSRENRYVTYYSYDDERVTEDDSFFRKPLVLFTDNPVLQSRQLRLGVLDPRNEEIHQYRYFFLYDNRVPGPPRISVEGNTPFRDSVTAHIKGPEGVDMYYTLDGSTPDEFSREYEGPFEITPPRDVDTGSVRLQAVAKSRSGKRSPVTSRLIEYDTRRPETPEPTIRKRTDTSVTIEFQGEGARYYRYETAFNSSPADPTDSSPRTHGQLTLRFPRGFSAETQLKVVAEDRAGNISGGLGSLQFSIDTVPPETPDVSLQDGELRVEGEGTPYYTIVSASRKELLPQYPPKKNNFEMLEGNVSVEGREGKRTVYRAWAFVEDKAGNRSAVSSTGIHTVDMRSPVVPEIDGTTKKNLYNRPLTVSLSSEAGEEAIEYRLASARGGKNPQPGESAEFKPYTEPLELEGSEGERVVYLLQYRGRISGGEDASELQEERFVIDRAPPPEPELRGINDGGTYSQPVLVRTAASEKLSGNRVWLWYATEEEISQAGAGTASTISSQKLRKQGRPVEDGLIVDCPEGEIREYTIFAASFDKAGNATFLPAPLHVTIDRKPPTLPQVNVEPEERITAENVRVTAEKGDYTSIRYELLEGSEIPPVPGKDSAATQEPLTFTGREGERQVYHLRYRAEDEAGNLSERTGNLRWLIDRRTPNKPVIDVQQIGGRRCVVDIRSAMEESAIFVSTDGNRYTSYTGPFIHRVEDENVRGSLQAYAQSPTGVQSDIRETECLVLPVGASLIEGIQDGNVYARDVVLEAQRSDVRDSANLRYRIVQGPGEKILTTPFSALFPANQLHIKTPEGQSNIYRISVGLYTPELTEALRSETYTIRIDKEAPRLPALRGVENNGYFTEARTIAFELEEKEAEIHYSLDTRGEPVDSFERYKEPFTVGTDPGTMKEYRLTYYAVDEVGNRSDTKDVAFTIDRDGIYVSHDGSNRGTGGRNTPYRSLDRALQEARQSERSTIVLAKGDYTLREQLAPQKKLTLKGGYDSENWQATGQQSTISLSEEFEQQEGEPVIRLEDEELALQRILFNTAGRSGSDVIDVRKGGELSVNDSTLVTGSVKDDSFIMLENSSIVLENSRIDAGPMNEGRAIEAYDSNVELRDSWIVGGKNVGRAGLLYAKNGRVLLESSVLDPGEGSRLTGAEIDGGTFTARNSTLHSGNASIRAVNLKGLDAEIQCTDTKFRTRKKEDGSGQLLNGIVTEGGTVTLEECSIRTSGYKGAVAVKAEKSSIALQGSTIRMDDHTEFSYIVRASGGTLQVENSLFTAGKSFDNIMFDLQEIETEMVSLTLVHGGGERISTAVRYTGSHFRVTSSVLAGAPEIGGTALLLSTVPDRFSIENNVFSGWPVILKRENAAPITSIKQLKEPREPFGDTRPFGGNLEEDRSDMFQNEELFRLQNSNYRGNYGYSPPPTR